MPGPLSEDDLLAIWRALTDDGYNQPLVDQPDSGVEVYGQAAAQYARASEAVDRTTQAMYVRPWSGQTAPPAGLAAAAVTQLEWRRTEGLGLPLVLAAGLTVAQAETDYGPDGGVPIDTGRRYALGTNAAFLPGDPGPIVAAATAERPGWGYNNALPGTITQILQLGVGASGTAGVMSAGNVLTTPEGSDYVLSAVHVGQYVDVTTTTEGVTLATQRRRVLSYDPAGPSVTLDHEAWLAGTGGPLVVGETVSQDTTGATGVVIAASATFAVIEVETGEFATGYDVAGEAATMTDVVCERIGAMSVGDAVWAVVPWAAVGLSATNPEQPTGGQLGWLEEIGEQRGVLRQDGESEECYRARVADPADVVSPNALRRVVNAILASHGASVRLREVGTAELPGFFYDAGSSDDSPQDPARNFAYDMDPDVREADRWKVWLDRTRFRAYFLAGIPELTPAVHKLVYAALDNARVVGVRFELYVEE